jgi:hypothetical protein
MMRQPHLWIACAVSFLALEPSLADPATVCRAGEVDGAWESDFRAPPGAARPWVYWCWMNGNMTREGITADLEAMKRVGIGGVLLMELNDGTPVGPVAFAGSKWRELFKHTCAEAHRLGLEVNMNNDAGWEGSGGPWITPELAMQKVVWKETAAEGPKHLEAVLPAPQAVENYYRDIRVLAFPTPAGSARIGNLAFKSEQYHTDVLPAPALWPETPAEETVPRDRVVDLTANVDGAGRLTWDVPQGMWTILRIGHTLTGALNSPAPASGCGLECDKLSKEAAETHFAALMGKLIADVGPLVGKSLVATHIDSWENGSQNWTPKFREEFQRRRGYDLLPYLPVIAGWIVENREVSERFLWDFRQTINELLLQNYAGQFREMAHRHGLRLTIEAYADCPCDELAYAGRADEPSGEFWSWSVSAGQKYGFGLFCTETTSAAHVYGKRIVAAEAFTANNKEKWLGHPGNIKDLGDWAFCEGINRFLFHRYAMQPWPNVRPGMALGAWGLHYERTQTWWEMSKAWHEYLARCQYLLRQGLFVADVCYLGAEGSPQSLRFQKRFLAKSSANSEEPRDRTGYNFDICPPDAILTRMSVKDGRLVLPDGMSYRLLVLPMHETMTPQLLGKVKELVEAGATVVGCRPVKSPSLSNYPQCDRDVQQLAAELWGTEEPPPQLTERKIGKGRLFSSTAFQKKSKFAGVPSDWFGSAQWIWYPEGEPEMAALPGKCYFRRIVALDPDRIVNAARIVMTADDAFTCWVNGRQAGTGDNYTRVASLDITSLLKPGENLLTVEAVNTADSPKPAGLIARLRIEYRVGQPQTIDTDKNWKSAKTVKERWNTDAKSGEGWTAAMEMGRMGRWSWGELDMELFPEEDIVNALLKKMGVLPDFDYRTKSAARSLRFTHRALDGADIYFVANKLPQPEEAVCSFRVQGKRPELWRPDTGIIEHRAVYDEADGTVRVPISFEPVGSVFVIFRDQVAPASERIVSVSRGGKELIGTAWQAGASSSPADKPVPVEEIGVQLTVDRENRLKVQVGRPGKYSLKYADGSSRQFEVARSLPIIELNDDWDIAFLPKDGGPEHVKFDKLISWSDHPDKGVTYYSGAATYTKKFTDADDQIAKDWRYLLDLGRVEVMAEVKLNGKDLGILWKPPYRVDISSAIRPGKNTLAVKVVNLLINRQIGDEFLPEDSDRNPDGTLKSWPKWLLEGKSSPTGRYTFTSWRLWHKDDPLQPSGLLGPVRILHLPLHEVRRSTTQIRE